MTASHLVERVRASYVRFGYHSRKPMPKTEDKATTVLCIDDEEPGLKVRKILLESAGHRVLTARSGGEGIRVFQAEPVDAVILDYWMSGMNGVAVARELKRLRPSTPIIILSAYGTILDE